MLSSRTYRRLNVGALLLAVLGSGFVFARNACAQVAGTQVEFSADITEIPVMHWRFVGPFQYDRDDLKRAAVDQLQIGLNHDYLQEDFGRAEASVTAKEFVTFGYARRGTSADGQFKNTVLSSDPETHILELAGNVHTLDYVVGYAGAEIDSPRAQRIAIAAGADDSMKIWLNHDLLFADRNSEIQGLRKYQRVIGADLRKGRNFLLVKICNQTKMWRLIVNFAPFNQGVRLAEENGVNPILPNSVLPADRQVIFRGDLLPLGSRVKAEVLDSRHKVVEAFEVRPAQRMEISASKLRPEELYYARVSYSGRAIERPFYYGRPENAYRDFQSQINQLPRENEEVSIDLRAEVMRLDHLLAADSRTRASWGQKTAHCIAELENGFAYLKESPRVFLHAPGTHIRGYESSVDGSVQYYWLHVPASAVASGKPIPLVIALPFITSNNDPFLESYFLAAFDESERYRILGNEYGYAVLQVWGRGNYLGGTALGTSDVFEALAAVEKDYPIDRDRIYLVGYCEAGRLALLLGERHPHQFAAISVQAPITVERTNARFAQRWVSYASPVSDVARLVGTPVLITHDPADTIPIQESENFVQLCQKAGVSATLVQLHGGTHDFYQDPMSQKRSMFEFFRGKRLQPVGLQVSAQAEHGFESGRGPIEDAFGSPFVIVAGTQGTPEQQAAVRHVVQILSDEWQKAYYVNCRVEKDSEVAPADVQKYNLVIVGDAATNLLAARIGPVLPMRATAEDLTLAGMTYRGQHLGYEFVLPNPLNPKRYVVMIGMTQWTGDVAWQLNPSRYGICDYFVFNFSYPRPVLEGAGYFDRTVWHRSDGAHRQLPN